MRAWFVAGKRLQRTTIEICAFFHPTIRFAIHVILYIGKLLGDKAGSFPGSGFRTGIGIGRFNGNSPFRITRSFVPMRSSL